MDYRLDYISRVFAKLKSKPIEKYAITRIWHLMDDLEVKVVPQQYVKREFKKYAFTDLYFPQLKIHIEINEPAHYLSEEKIEIDKLRKEQIINSTNHKVIEIDCRGTIEEINERIGDAVKSIKKEINELRESNKFKPWRPQDEYSVNYYKEQERLRVEDDVQLKTIEEICQLFDAPLKKRGYLRPGAAIHPDKENILLWWPSTSNRKGWINQISEDESTILETNEDENTRKNHIKKQLNSQRKERYVFLHNRDMLGMTSYKFKGIYKLNEEESTLDKGVIWSRVSKEIKMK